MHGQLGENSRAERRAPVTVHRGVGAADPLVLEEGGRAVSAPPPALGSLEGTSVKGTVLTGWTPPGAVTGYEVQYNGDFSGNYPEGSWRPVPGCSALDAGRRSCLHGGPGGGLDKGDRYRYRARARNAVGRGEWSPVGPGGGGPGGGPGDDGGRGEQVFGKGECRPVEGVREERGPDLPLPGEGRRGGEGGGRELRCGGAPRRFFGMRPQGAVPGRTYRYEVRAYNGEGWGPWEGTAPVLAAAAGMVALGKEHSCALTAGGEVKCWGGGTIGQLGDGPAVDRSAPVATLAGNGTPDPLGGVVQVVAGGWHTCGVSGGGMKCWGYGKEGQLGGGGASSGRVPAPVVAGEGTADPLEGVLQASAGSEHTCAVLSGGGVRCWGNGSGGRLGNGRDSNRLAPVAVVAGEGTTDALEGVVQVDAGGEHTCAVVSGGGVRCWGRGSGGRLGNGGDSDAFSPVAVAAGRGLLGDAVQVSAGTPTPARLFRGEGSSAGARDSTGDWETGMRGARAPRWRWSRVRGRRTPWRGRFRWMRGAPTPARLFREKGQVLGFRCPRAAGERGAAGARTPRWRWSRVRGRRTLWRGWSGWPRDRGIPAP